MSNYTKSDILRPWLVMAFLILMPVVAFVILSIFPNKNAGTCRHGNHSHDNPVNDTAKFVKPENDINFYDIKK